jgi:hypothetical protein
MTIDRDRFYQAVRERPFGGRLSQSQVNGINSILDQWERRKPNGDRRWLAYMLGTAYHETAFQMQPVREIGRGRGRPYGVPAANGQTYYGRGYVQLTWQNNYEAAGRLIGVDLVGNPDLALNPSVAADVMFAGMEHGTFTGVGLPHYFNATTDDPVNARRIINGMDCADAIAGYHAYFLAGVS